MNLEQLLDKKLSELKSATLATNCIAVTPSDTVDLFREGKIIVLTTAGNVKVLTSGGQIVTLTLALKEVLPISIKRVFNTDTTAVGIYVIY
jgi:hypothetical protein